MAVTISFLVYRAELGASTGPRDGCDPFAWQANGDSLPSDHRARGSKQFCRLPSTSQPRPLEPPTVCGLSAVHHRFEVRARRLRRDRHGRPLACSDHCLLRSALAVQGRPCRNACASWRGNTTAVERQSHHAHDAVADGVLQSRHTLGMRSARRQRFSVCRRVVQENTVHLLRCHRRCSHGPVGPGHLSTMPAAPRSSQNSTKPPQAHDIGSMFRLIMHKVEIRAGPLTIPTAGVSMTRKPG